VSQNRERKLTSREASEYTGIPVRSLLTNAKADPPRLRAYWMGPRGPVLFDRADLDAFVEATANMAPAAGN
jgi:hypothetical protein